MNDRKPKTRKDFRVRSARLTQIATTYGPAWYQSHGQGD